MAADLDFEQHKAVAANDDAAKQATSSLHACVFDTHIGTSRTDSVWEDGQRMATRHMNRGELSSFSLDLDGNHYEGLMAQGKAQISQSGKDTQRSIGADTAEYMKVEDTFTSFDFDHLPSCKR